MDEKRPKERRENNPLIAKNEKNIGGLKIIFFITFN